MTDDEKELMVLTIQNAVHDGIDGYAAKANTIMDEKVERHKQLCQANMPNMITEAVKGALTDNSVLTNGRKIKDFIRRHWLSILIVAILVFNRLSIKPVTVEEIENATKPVTVLLDSDKTLKAILLPADVNK